MKRKKVDSLLKYKLIIGIEVLLIVAVISFFVSGKKLLTKLTIQAQSTVTPIEQSGLTPLWKEDFSGGKMDRLQFAWAKGSNSDLKSRALLGMAYIGKEGSTNQVEQELFNYKSNTTGWPRTVEFDIFSPQNGRGRTSIRLRPGGDFVHMNFALPGDQTKINFRFGAYPSYIYNELTGPNHGWTHVVVSYEQVTVGGTVEGHYVLAVNGEIREYQGKSNIPTYNDYWTNTPEAFEWNIESSSTEVVYGRYIKNIRAYREFIPLSQMQARLAGVNEYRATLPDPRGYSGPSKVFQSHKNLTQEGPNAMMYYDQTGPLTLEFDGTLSSSWSKITTFAWNFGDGSSGEGRVVSHTYAAAGTYQVGLTVVNAKGGSDFYSMPVTVVASSITPTQPTPTETPGPSPTSTPTPTDTLTPTATVTPGAVITVTPLADAFVQSSYPSKNYGTSQILKADGSPVKISYLKFAIPNMSISSAKLRLMVSEGSTATENIKEVPDTTWQETGISYNSRPALGNVIGTIPKASTGNWVETDISSYLQGKAGQIIALGIDSSASDNIDFSSKESANKPGLVIQ